MNDAEQITGIVFFALFMILIFFFALALAVRYRKRRKENEILKAKYELEIKKVQSEIQEQTLHYIGQELHDNIGHIASLTKINLNTINVSLLSPEENRKIENTKELMRQLIFDLKQLSVRLSNDRVINNGLISAMEIEGDRLKKTGQYSVVIDIGEHILDIQQDKALILYRMLQEAINNIMKHSHASIVRLTLKPQGQHTILEICDNGIGFNTSHTSEHEGAGLKNLKNRANILNASLIINSNQEKGTTISIVF
jgi:signal transduction histidine kinase